MAREAVVSLKQIEGCVGGSPRSPVHFWKTNRPTEARVGALCSPFCPKQLTFIDILYVSFRDSLVRQNIII